MNAGATTLTGWTIFRTDTGVLLNGNAYRIVAQAGVGSLDLTGYENKGFPRGVSQTLLGLTVAGQPWAEGIGNRASLRAPSTSRPPTPTQRQRITERA